MKKAKCIVSGVEFIPTHPKTWRTKKSYVIKDQAGNILDTPEFETFNDGWAYIYENMTDNENEYDDYFVLPKE